MEITQTNLRYLLAVYELMGSNAGVAAVEVSRRMGVSKPSVTWKQLCLHFAGNNSKDRLLPVISPAGPHFPLPLFLYIYVLFYLLHGICKGSSVFCSF